MVNLKEDLAGVLFDTIADYLSKDRTPLREGNHRRKLIRDRQVSHGGSTWHRNHNGAYVHTSKETRRFSVLLYVYKYRVLTIQPL